MIPTALAPTYKTRFNIRPVRHVFFVSPNSREQTRRAMAYCCTMWGGIMSLIVPVRGAAVDDLDTELIRLFQPDAAVSYLPWARDREGRRNQDIEDWLSGILGRSVRLHAGGDYEEYDRAAHPLGVLPEGEAPQGQVHDIRFVGPERDQLALLALFGQVYPKQHDAYAHQLDFGVMPMRKRWSAVHGRRSGFALGSG